ncbi:hypothetical protein G3N57_03335 [Paraburkholderia sp. Se-20369]|nr:hypothetical protein [Paraburkholderia sp. Se-20369]
MADAREFIADQYLDAKIKTFVEALQALTPPTLAADKAVLERLSRTDTGAAGGFVPPDPRRVTMRIG